MIKYKLTNQNMQTHNGFQWEIGVKKTIEIPGDEMCSAQVFHFYNSPLLAVLLNPIHADIKNPRIFEVECDQVAHDGIKGGAKEMTLLREIEMPVITTKQRVAFGILCAKQVCKNAAWNKWADNWLNGSDTTAEAAAAEWSARAAELEINFINLAERAMLGGAK